MGSSLWIARQRRRRAPSLKGVYLQRLASLTHVTSKGHSRATGHNLNICHSNVGVRTKKTQTSNLSETSQHRCLLHSRDSPQPKPPFLCQRLWDFQKRQRTWAKRRTSRFGEEHLNSSVDEIHRPVDEDKEVLGIKLMFESNPLSIYNLYSPPPNMLQPEGEKWIIMGDFSSHSPSWGYRHLDHKGDEVEDWIITNQIALINHTYYSWAWQATSCPDIAIATDDVVKMTERHVEQQLAGSDHKPVLLVIKQDLRQAGRKLCPSWNYKRANWPEFRLKKNDENCRNLKMEQHRLNEKVNIFTGAILSSAKETIPRGRRRDYIPGWNAQLQDLHSTVSRLKEKMVSCRTDDNTNAHNKAKAKFKRHKLQQTRPAWRENKRFLSTGTKIRTSCWSLLSC